VSLPSGLTYIGSSAFSQCTALSEITLPDAVKTIDSEAFRACTNLKKIVISCNVVTMESNIFAGCTKLTIYGYQNSEAQTYANANDIPFVSQWKYVTVKFEAGNIGYLSSGEEQKNVGVGEKYGTLPSVKAYSSCKFEGWYTEKTGGTKVTESTICKETITTLYAQYTYTTATKLTKATTKEDGKIVTYYVYNNQTISTKAIKKISGMTLKYSSTVYTGASLKPAVTVKDSAGKVISSSYYTVTYSKNKNVGTATVTVKFSGNYSGTLKKTFTIVPKPTTISKLTGDKQKLTVKWKKQATQTTGYQIQYSTNKKFSGAKTVTAGSAKTVSKTITRLSAKKTYYVRIRTYKKNGKTYYYSKWSAASKVKTK
jgi:hypothetical protein